MTFCRKESRSQVGRSGGGGEKIGKGENGKEFGLESGRAGASDAVAVKRRKCGRRDQRDLDFLQVSDQSEHRDAQCRAYAVPPSHLQHYD
jgi:hypothetical protein